MFHIVLFQPEIPPNTGNIMRLCANTGSRLHLVKPLGFELQHKAVRRAGLDYDELAEVRVHPSLEACLQELRAARAFSVETRSCRSLRLRARRSTRVTTSVSPAAKNPAEAPARDGYRGVSP